MVLLRARQALPCLAVLVASRTAAADLKMKWDCYLPGTGIDCGVLESSLTSKIPFLKSVSAPQDADVVVTLTSVPAEDGTRYHFHFEGKAVEGFSTEGHTTDKIPGSIDAGTTTVRIITKLERGLADFMDQKIAAEVKGGKLDIELIDPVKMPFAGRPEQDSLKWYLAPGVGTYFSDVEGVGINASGNASVRYNYSAATWRVQQSVGANYSRQSQPVPGTGETASVSFSGGSASTVIASSLGGGGRWNAGLLLAAEKNPQANYEARGNASAGIEFDLVPRQTVNQKNLGLRCAAGPELQRYDAVNIEGLYRQLVARQFCDIFASWHFSPVDLWANLGETTILTSIDYRSFSVGLSAIWRVTDNFTVSPWVNLQGTYKAINEARATNVVFSDPRQEIEASLLSAVQQGYTAPFGVQSGLSVRYLFGNGSLDSEDQRWKNTSNLR